MCIHIPHTFSTDFPMTIFVFTLKMVLCFYLKRCPLFEISILELLKRFFLCIYFRVFIEKERKKMERREKRSRSYLSCGWRFYCNIMEYNIRCRYLSSIFGKVQGVECQKYICQKVNYQIIHGISTLMLSYAILY